MLRVSVDEGHALEVLDFLCRGRAVRIVPTQPIEVPRPELVEVAARRMAVACTRLLSETGWQEQTVLRGGRRVRGRIWDPKINDGFRLRFTAASFELWIQTTQRLTEVARDTEVVEGGGASKRARRQIRKIIKIAETDTGDWLVYALAARHLERGNIPAEIREDFARRLCLGSPLATLFALDPRLQDSQHTLAAHLDLLFEGPAVRLLECIPELLAEQWAGRVEATMRHLPGEARAARVGAAAQVLEGYVERLEARRRLDLARPLCDALGRLLAGAWAGDPAATIRKLLADAALPAHGQRDLLRRALARIAGLGERLWALREEMARERYGDRRYEEAQLYLALCDERLRPHLRGLSALASALTGRIG